MCLSRGGALSIRCTSQSAVTGLWNTCHLCSRCSESSKRDRCRRKPQQHLWDNVVFLVPPERQPRYSHVKGQPKVCKTEWRGKSLHMYYSGMDERCSTECIWELLSCLFKIKEQFREKLFIAMGGMSGDLFEYRCEKSQQKVPECCKNEQSPQLLLARSVAGFTVNLGRKGRNSPLPAG